MSTLNSERTVGPNYREKKGASEFPSREVETITPSSNTTHHKNSVLVLTSSTRGNPLEEDLASELRSNADNSGREDQERMRVLCKLWQSDPVFRPGKNFSIMSVTFCTELGLGTVDRFLCHRMDYTLIQQRPTRVFCWPYTLELKC